VQSVLVVLVTDWQVTAPGKGNNAEADPVLGVCFPDSDRPFSAAELRGDDDGEDKEDVGIVPSRAAVAS
jgi:hypothetical protein